jgi:hypothetical protein
VGEALGFYGGKGLNRFYVKVQSVIGLRMMVEYFTVGKEGDLVGFIVFWLRLGFL